MVEQKTDPLGQIATPISARDILLFDDLQPADLEDPADAASHRQANPCCRQTSITAFSGMHRASAGRPRHVLPSAG